MRRTAIWGALGVIALLGAAPTVEARSAHPHHKTMKRVKAVVSPRPPAGAADYPVVRRHKCIVGCG